MQFELDKNGQNTRDLYCWKCTGSHSKMRHKESGKGRMRAYEENKNIIRYRCIKCDAFSEYDKDGFKDYGIQN